MGHFALLLTLLAFGFAVIQWMGAFNLQTPEQIDQLKRGRAELFTHLLVYDRLAIALKVFLLGFTALVMWLTLLTGIPDREDSADFNVLLLGATLGMMLMASSNHLHHDLDRHRDGELAELRPGRVPQGPPPEQ